MYHHTIKKNWNLKIQKWKALAFWTEGENNFYRQKLKITLQSDGVPS